MGDQLDVTAEKVDCLATPMLSLVVPIILILCRSYELGRLNETESHIRRWKDVQEVEVWLDIYGKRVETHPKLLKAQT